MSSNSTLALELGLIQEWNVSYVTVIFAYHFRLCSRTRYTSLSYNQIIVSAAGNSFVIITTEYIDMSYSPLSIRIYFDIPLGMLRNLVGENEHI